MAVRQEDGPLGFVPDQYMGDDPEGVKAAGEINVGLSRLGGGPGASGTGVLATFEFLAVGSGDSGFAFDGASVRDPQGQSLPALFSTVPVRVVP